MFEIPAYTNHRVGLVSEQAGEENIWKYLLGALVQFAWGSLFLRFLLHLRDFVKPCPGIRENLGGHILTENH